MPEFSDIHVVPCREKLGKKLGIGFPGVSRSYLLNQAGDY